MEKLFSTTVHWDWWGKGKHAVLFYVGARLVVDKQGRGIALHISKEKAELLVKAGADHAS